MIADGRLGDGRHARADRLETLCELAAAGVDGSLIVGWRLASDQGVDGLEQPRLLGFAER